jgi:hypothetical protein
MFSVLFEHHSVHAISTMSCNNCQLLSFTMYLIVLEVMSYDILASLILMQETNMYVIYCVNI